MKQLSPSAEAIWEAFNQDDAGVFVDYGDKLAAALEATANRLLPHQSEAPSGDNEPWPRDYQLISDARWEQRQITRGELLAIAAELKERNTLASHSFAIWNETTMGRVTGDQVREAMKAANITDVDHHNCALCGEMVFYFRDGDQLFFNSGCGCSWSPPRPVSWDSAANWINMQSKAEVRKKLMVRFGLTPRVST